MDLAFKGISKRFGATKALDNISADLSGKVCVLLGSNGSGKTTLINCLCGLTIPQKGMLEFDGEKYDASDGSQWRHGTERIRRKSGFSGDKLGVPGSYTGRELMDWTARAGNGKVDAGWIDHVVEVLDMKSYIGNRLSGYSSGMMQKASIATSLMGQPEIVFWDEPTSNMDARGRRQVTDLVAELSQNGVKFVIATHIPAEFEGLVDWAGVMILGRFVRAGSVSELVQGSNEYEVVTDDPRLFASRLIETGIGIQVSIFADHVLFTAVSPNQRSLESMEDLAKATGCSVKSLRQTSISVGRLYAESLGSGEQLG